MRGVALFFAGLAVSVTCTSGGGTSDPADKPSQRICHPSIHHIVVMLQENRSFDNYFGKLNDYRVSQGLPADVDGSPVDASDR